jgi:hypothetical protein
MSDLYLPEGWPNIEFIDGLGCWINVLISARQVGKTYSVLKYLIEQNRTHLFTRRTRHELEAIATNPILNPYDKLQESGIHVTLKGSPDKMMDILGYDLDNSGKQVVNNNFYGIATSLTEIAAVRGFNGGAFTDWVFDEFIPEKIVVTRKAEGDAFLNAHVTINSNRELMGQEPVKTWLLANTNKIDSPILDALDIVDDVLYLQRKGQEYMVTDNKVFIGLLKSEKIIEKRKETRLMKQISKKSDFYGMAINSEFSYDDSPYIQNISIKHLQPVWSYDNKLYCWETSNGYYICRAPFRSAHTLRYSGSRTDREKLRMDFIWMKPYYYAGCILFSDLRMLSIFKQIFDID